MAATVHDTIRLDSALTGILPTAEYYVRQDGWRDQNTAQITVDYSVTGQAHVHRARDGGGTIVQHRDHIYVMLLTRAQYLTLRGLVGKILYFMPHLRDEADVAYREVVVLNEMQDEILLEPNQMTYFLTTIILKAAAGCTVD